MRVVTYVVLFVLLGGSSVAFAQVWESSVAFPTGGVARTYAVGLAQGSTVLAIGGTPFDPAGPDGIAHQWMLGQTNWTALPTLDGPIVQQCGGIDALGRIVIFAGWDPVGGDESDVRIYDLDEGFKGDIAQRSSTAPFANVTGAIDDAKRLYSIGGGPGSTATSAQKNSTRVERYDAQFDAWAVLAPLPYGIADAAACNDGAGRVLVIGGFAATGTRSADVLSYDIATNTWSANALPDLPIATSGARAARGADNRVYVVGGATATGVTNAVWKLDPVTHTWSAGPSLATPRQHFGLVLASDDALIAMGGENGAGGTATVERLFTPKCPTIVTQPASMNAYLDMTVTLSVGASGGAPLAYAWRRDGVALSDGSLPGGGFAHGTHAASLVLADLSVLESGAYDCVVSNACGSIVSDAAHVDVKNVHLFDGVWSVTPLHPASALNSSASGVEHGVVVGTARYPYSGPLPYTSFDQAVAWDASSGFAPQVLTPANSVQSTAADVMGGTIVGTFWKPFQTQFGTTYYPRACRWDGPSHQLVELWYAGLEITHAWATDGVQTVGSGVFDESSTNSTGVMWTGTGGTWLTPSGVWGSGAAAVWGGNQYGSVHVGFGVMHAARWSGSAASFVDMNPPGSPASGIADAWGDQQVGSATVAGLNGAALWTGTPSSAISLHPAGVSSSSVVAVRNGIQVGSVTIGGAGHAAAWLGSPQSFADLHGFVPPAFSSSYASEIEVAHDGTIWIVGGGFNTTTQRQEALVWRHNPDAFSGDVATIDASAGGTQHLTLFAGPSHASAEYWVLGSLTGTMPGLAFGPGLVLPLTYDFYTQFTLTSPNTPILAASHGTLDSAGSASASFNVPPLALPFPITVHHAYVLIDGGLVSFTSNQVPVELDP
jgi:hypothetical protein